MRTPASDSYTKRQQPTALPEHFFNRLHEGSEMIIYAISNTVNSKKYIGQTTRTIEERWSKHKSASTHCSALHSAMHKYGVEKFRIEQIDTANNQEELDAKEKYYIEFYNTIAPNGYNLTSGGEHPNHNESSIRKISESRRGEKHWAYGKTMPLETRIKISNANKGKKRSEEFKQKLRVANIGKKLSKDQIEKLRLSHLGKPLSEEHKRKIGAANKGRTISAETRHKISLANTGKVHSGESRRKIRESKLGQKLSDEVKQKISAAQKGKTRSEETKRKIAEGRLGEKHHNARKVECVETGVIYNCLKLAESETKIKSTNIVRSCKRGLKAGGYHWRYVDGR